MYDSVGQFRQALSGRYEDWHPPIMARLWGLLHGAFGGRGGPMLALQMGLYWLGFGLIADALVSTGKWRASVAVLMLAASPLLLGWQTAILKDSQMLGALATAVGLIAARRLRGRNLPLPSLVPLALLFAYAILVRANAVFAVVPLVILLAPRPANWPAKLAAIAVLTLAVIAVSPLINHRLLGASPSAVEKTQPLYDLAGIGVRAPQGSPFTPEELATISAKHCVKPFFWDPLGDESGCQEQIERLQSEPAATLYTAWARAVVAHPVAYARHRLAHWNSTERWQVSPGLIGATPPRASEPNDIGLATPSSSISDAIQRAGAVEAGTPLGWPIVWTFLALCGFSVAVERRETSAGGIALALAGSALAMEASFLVVSIASDLRYHLWAMTASALALILLADGTRLRRAPVVIAALVLAAIIAAGLQTRATLPLAPDSYAAMVASRTN